MNIRNLYKKNVLSIILITLILLILSSAALNSNYDQQANWKFDDNGGTSALNSPVNSNTGILRNSNFNTYSGSDSQMTTNRKNRGIITVSGSGSAYTGVKFSASDAKVSTPTFSPQAGTYHEPQSVSISSATKGAIIHYTLNGATPTESSPVYSGPISISTNTTIKAGTWKNGFTPSTIASATYVIVKPVLTSITVSPSSASIADGSTQTFIGSPKDQFGNTINTIITWASSNISVGTINSAGMFTATGAGVTAITAKNGSVRGTATATVTSVAGLIDDQKFEENAGTTASDSSGNGNTGTLKNFNFNSNSGWTAGKIGAGIKFDGINDYVDVPDSNSLDATTLTFEAWIKYNGVDSQLTSNKKIISKKAKWSDSNGWSVELGKGGTVTVLGSGSLYYRTNVLNSWDNAWHHLAVTFSGSTMNLYLDGNLKGSGTINSLVANNVPLSIGRMQGETTSFFNGTIDEVKMYKRALSASEINGDYLKSGQSTVKVSTPTFSPSAGTYGSTQSVSISTATAGATIHYTLNGATPTETSSTYSGQISISANMTIKAGAWKSGLTPSTIASASYIIARPVLTSIAVSPSSASVAKGSTQTFTASAKDQFGNPITTNITWSSSNTSVGTINSAGVLTAKVPGTSVITATSGAVKGTATVTVPATSTSSFRFIAWADTKTGTSTLTSESKIANALNPAFTIYPGDLSDCTSSTNPSCFSNGFSTWRNAFNGGGTNNLLDKSFITRGNHDANTDTPWRANFNFTATAVRVRAANYKEQSQDMTYSFDYGNSHFVGIDMPGGSVTTMSSAQMTWLDNDLTAAENRGLTHAFLFWHGPVYTVDGHCCETASAALVNVLNKHPIVAAGFFGHEHVVAYRHINNSRIPGITYEFEEFISGDAGAGPNTIVSGRADGWLNSNGIWSSSGTLNTAHGFMAVDVSGNNYAVSVYKLDGSVAKTFSFSN